MRFGLVFLNFFLNDDAAVLLAFILKKEKLKQSKFLIGGGTLRVLVSRSFTQRVTHNLMRFVISLLFLSFPL